MGIESHSLDRVHRENRDSPSSVVMGLLWTSAMINIGCFSTGLLGNKFRLSLGQTIPIVIFATLLGPSGNMLSLTSVVYGSSASWSSIVSGF